MEHPLTDGDDLAWWLIEKAIEGPEQSGGAGGTPENVYGSTPISYGGNGDVIIGKSTTQADPMNCALVCIALAFLMMIVFIGSGTGNRSDRRRLAVKNPVNITPGVYPARQ